MEGILSARAAPVRSQMLRPRSKEANGRRGPQRRCFGDPRSSGTPMLANRLFLGIAALLLATSGWGGMFLVSKDVLHHVDPAWFTLIRYSVSALLFTALLLPRGAAPWRKLRTHALPLALRGLVGYGVFSVMLLAGLAHSVPSHGALIIGTMPMTTQLLRWGLDGIRPSRSALLTAALALAGVVIVSGVLFAGGPAGGSPLPGGAPILRAPLGRVR